MSYTPENDATLRVRQDMEQSQVVLQASLMQVLHLTPRIVLPGTVLTVLAMIVSSPDLSTSTSEVDGANALWTQLADPVLLGMAVFLATMGAVVTTAALPLGLRVHVVVRDNTFHFRPLAAWLWRMLSLGDPRLSGLDARLPVAARDELGVVVIEFADGKSLRIASGANQPSDRTQVVALIQQAIDAGRAPEGDSAVAENIGEAWRTLADRKARS